MNAKTLPYLKSISACPPAVLPQELWKLKQPLRKPWPNEGIEAQIHCVGCIGHCYAEPWVIIENPETGFPPIFYPQVTAGKAKMLTKLYLEEGDPRLEHILGAMEENEMIPSVWEFSRFSQEKRIVMDLCGKIDPDDIYEYIAEDGYSSWANALKISLMKF
jgi:NADH-quinone oxidoreductase subunit F